jgi:hypothetical protein
LHYACLNRSNNIAFLIEFLLNNDVNPDIKSVYVCASCNTLNRHCVDDTLLIMWCLVLLKLLVAATTLSRIVGMPSHHKQSSVSWSTARSNHCADGGRQSCAPTQLRRVDATKRFARSCKHRVCSNHAKYRSMTIRSPMYLPRGMSSKSRKSQYANATARTVVQTQD